MSKLKQNTFLLVVPIIVVIGFAIGCGTSSAPGGNAATTQGNQPIAATSQPANNLQQAATTVAAAAKERISAAKSDDETIQSIRLSVDALQNIGRLGQFDTNPQTEELIETFRSANNPVAIDALIQLRIAGVIRDWEELSPAEHAAAFDHFTADIKKTGLTRGQADTLVRISHMLGDGPERGLITKSISELLPLAQSSKDEELNKMAALYEGILRRLQLPGKPLELEGTLLTGAKLDWPGYRGKVVLVDFFASFCDQCRAEVPNVLANYQAYHDKGFEIVGVNLDKTPQLAKQYIDQTGFNFPTIFGEDPSANGWNLPLARKYAVIRIPRAILVDQRGNVVSTMAIGGNLANGLEKLLGPADHPPMRTTSINEDPSVKTAGGSRLDTSVVPASAQEEVEPQTAPAAPDAPAPPKE
jgi:thiol-disulfide isomerase/thioredoxin